MLKRKNTLLIVPCAIDGECATGIVRRAATPEPVLFKSDLGEEGVRSTAMPIVEGIGDEIILFLAAVFIAAIVISVFIFPSQNVSPSSSESTTPSHPSSNIEEQDNRPTRSFSDQLVESRNENTGTDSNQYPNETHALPPNANNSVVNNETQDLHSVDHCDTQTDRSNNPEFLRKHRLKFFGEILDSSNAERINNGIISSSDASGEAAAVLYSQQSEISASGDITAEESSSHETNIRIRLKYLNDTERLVHSKLDDKIGEFRRKHFLEDITNNKIIRLIYNGQLLRGEDRTLESFGISDNSVIHVQISQNQQSQGSSTADDSDLDLSHLMWPLFGIILGVLWMLHFQYREYFNIASTVALVGITGLFLMAVWSQSNFHRSPTQQTESNQRSSFVQFN